LNLKISTFRQNIKNLVGNFGGIHARILHAKFQVSSSTGVEENERTAGRADKMFLPRSKMKFLTPPLLRSEGIKNFFGIYGFLSYAHMVTSEGL